MRIAIVNNATNKVVNIGTGDALPVAPTLVANADDTMPEQASDFTDFTYVDSDSAQVGDTYNASAGTFTAPAPPVPIVQPWTVERQQRNGLLQASDWTQLPDVPLSASMKAEYVAYRTSLRNLPQTYPDASKIVWPALPT